MTISVILRLTVPALREGRLAGQAEIVSDGTRLVIRVADELIEAVRRHIEASRPGPRGDDRSPVDDHGRKGG